MILLDRINSFPGKLKTVLYILGFAFFSLLWGFGQYPDFFYIRFFGAVPLLFIILYRKHYLLETLFFGAIAYAVNFYWLFYTFHESGKINPVISIGLIGILCLYYGLQYPLIAFIYRKFHDFNSKLFYSFPVVFVFVDFLFIKIFRHTICDGLINFYYFIQIIDITGMTGVILVVMLFNLGLFRLMENMILGRKIRPAHFLFVVPVMFCLVYGFFRVSFLENQARSLDTTSAAMIQGNITGKQKMDSSYFRINIDRYNSLTRKANHDDVDFIIWPESVFNRAYDGTRDSLKRLIFENYKPLILGITYWGDDDTDEFSPDITNSCFLIKNQNAVLRYDKKHLLMFGEYVPLEKELPFLRYLTPLRYNLKKGNTPSIFRINDRVRACMSICFEDIFPDEIREKVNEGSNLMINITNDSWYGNTIGPVHHSVLARLRAIENRRSFFRCTATGVTTASTITGKVVAEGKVWTPQIVEARLPLYDKRTVYSYIGETFSYISILTVILIMIFIVCIKAFKKIKYKLGDN